MKMVPNQRQSSMGRTMGPDFYEQQMQHMQSHKKNSQMRQGNQNSIPPMMQQVAQQLPKFNGKPMVAHNMQPTAANQGGPATFSLPQESKKRPPNSSA
jgi:hypothetical protein